MLVVQVIPQFEDTLAHLTHHNVEKETELSEVVTDFQLPSFELFSRGKYATVLAQGFHPAG